MLARLASPALRPVLGTTLSLSLALLAAGCGGAGEATVTERLWVSAVPTNPKARTTAFLATKASDGKFIGAFFQGSAFRGGHDVFTWEDRGKDAASIVFLQDGRKVSLRFETCKPTTGFDHCVLVHGDPTGAKRYQSRKRWRVRRPGKKKEAGIASVMAAFAEVSAQDEDLHEMFAPAE